MRKYSNTTLRRHFGNLRIKFTAEISKQANLLFAVSGAYNASKVSLAIYTTLDNVEAV